MIRLEHLSKSFHRDGVTRQVLREVSLTLPEVQGLAILGRNGAGKSTLLRLIAGTLQPDRGRIVSNQSISWPMGFSGGFHPALSGAQNTRFVARIYGRNVDDMIDFVQGFSELGEAWTMPFETYSSGMKARLAFAVSMGVDFDCYLVDEIIGVGDSAFRKKCQRMFRQRMGRAQVLMISHSPATLRQFCQAGLVLERGALTCHADISDALEHHEANMAQTA